MNWRDPTRVGDRIAPGGKQPSRSFGREAIICPVPDSIATLPERRARKPPLKILDFVRSAVGFLLGIPHVHMGFSPSDHHPGWNVSDEGDVPPRGECRYLVELVSGQVASLNLVSTHPVEIVICDDDDYDSWEEGASWPDARCEIASDLCDGSLDGFSFRAPRTGAYDVIVSNPGGHSARVAIRITAPPARQGAKGPGRETRIRRFNALSIGDPRTILKWQGRRS